MDWLMDWWASHDWWKLLNQTGAVLFLIVMLALQYRCIMGVWNAFKSFFERLEDDLRGRH